VLFKINYETPESFTKAFTRFRGFTPTDIRQKREDSSHFNRLRIKLKVEGGKLLDYKITDLPNIQILAKSKKFSTSPLEEVR